MQVIIYPIITEKTLKAAERGAYSFVVDRRSGKVQIARAIEDLYKVKVIKVNITNYKGVEKTQRGRFKFMTKSYKKAFITLKKDQKIPGFGIEEKTKEKPKKKQKKVENAQA